MLRKLLAILISIVLFLAAFAVFAFLMIPVESISTWVQYKVNDSKTIQLDIGETERVSPGTIVLREISLDLDFASFRKEKRRSEEAKDAATAAAAKHPGPGKDATQAGAEMGPALKKARDAAQRKNAEAALLDRAIPGSAILVAADSRGKPVDSRWFAQTIDGARNTGRDLVFLVGGPSGLTDALRARADHLVAFGRITLNHDLATVVLAEQIWRGFAILNNHPYHDSHA